MNEERLMTILEAPHVSEKATIVADRHNQYVFRVAKDATKGEIKSAVEKMFEVEVEQVRVLNVKGKRKQRFGAGNGRRPDWKKAYVSLKAGAEIDFTGAE